MRILLTMLLVTAASAQQSTPVVSQASSRHSASSALSEAEPRSNKPGARSLREEHVVKPIPHTSAQMKPGFDTALQKRGKLFKLQALVNASKEGVGAGTYAVNSDPPDTVGASGLTQYVQWVNTAVQVFDKKTLLPLSKVLDGNSLWKGFGGNCETDNDGDPIVLFDKSDGGHWLLSQFSISKQPYSQCIAISQTEDSLGKYYLYEFQFDKFNDYGKFAIWPDGYYASFNMFGTDAQGSDVFQGSRVCGFDRIRMLKGDQATMQCFDAPQNGGLLVADWDGPVPPPAGEPAFVFALDTSGKAQLYEWRYHVDWTEPAKSMVSAANVIAVAPYAIACDSCVQQPKPGNTASSASLLDTLSDRLMFRVSYRNRLDHASIVLNHTVASQNGVGIRWYQLGVQGASGATSVTQQGTYSPDSLSRWMGSIAEDHVGNILIGFSASGPTKSPSIRVAGRSVSDPLGQLSSELSIQPGMGSQTGISRWGDYSSMTVDPVDDCQLYFTTLFLADAGSYNWHTMIARMNFPFLREVNC